MKRQEDRVLNLLELHAIRELRAPTAADAANTAALADGGWAGGAGPLRACACWAIGQVRLPAASTDSQREGIEAGFWVFKVELVPCYVYAREGEIDRMREALTDQVTDRDRR